jgi:hypothetical protein
MSHPLQSIPQEKRKVVFWSLFSATLAWMIIMQLVGAPLTTPAAPSGIVSFELAGNATQAKAILDSWDAKAQVYAAFGLGMDYVFMLLYSTTIALACIWAGEILRSVGWPLSKLGAGLAWGQWAAALFDAVENIALAVILLRGLASPWPELARWCALFKFALIFLGLVYAFFGLVARFSQRGKVFP